MNLYWNNIKKLVIRNLDVSDVWYIVLNTKFVVIEIVYKTMLFCHNNLKINLNLKDKL